MTVDDQPWSPFPVQDWSTLPPDPLGGAAINPTWPAPKEQRQWWRPLVVFGLVAALVAGAAFVASSVGVAARVTRAARYLPNDGAVTYERTATTQELKTTVGVTVTESAELFHIWPQRFSEATAPFTATYGRPASSSTS